MNITDIHLFKPLAGGVRIYYTWKGHECYRFQWRVIHNVEDAEDLLNELPEEEHRSNIIPDPRAQFKRHNYSENF